MALNKDLIEDTGLQVSYFRIAKAEVNFIKGTTNIIVEKYISEDYRNKAKQKEEVIKSIEALAKEIETIEDKDIKLSLHEKLINTETKNEELLKGEYSTGVDLVELDFIPETLTLANLYLELIKLERYKDSKEI